MIKRNRIAFLIGILAIGGILFYKHTPTQKEKRLETDESESVYSNEERPKIKLSEEEEAVNERHLHRYFDSKTAQKSVSLISSYANGKVKGSWEQVSFLSDGKTGYGFRVDGSVYDQKNDQLYAISYAGHIWKIIREGLDYTKTRWELINHKNRFLSSYIDGLNKSDGSFRMIRSSKYGMQYSNDEGRSWLTASGTVAIDETFEGAIAKTGTGNRIFTVLRTNSSTFRVYESVDDGLSYNALSTTFSAGTYVLKMFKASNSELVFIAAYSKSDSKISIYECSPIDSDFKLVNTSSSTFVGVDRVFGTYYNDDYHFYVVCKNTHIYYTGNKGGTWTLKNSSNGSTGDTNPRTVHPTKPNVIFQGYLDVNMSTNYGASFSNFSHLLGWDVHHMKMYQKNDGSYFHFVGKDFGCYIADQPEYKSSYLQLNNTAPIQMCYDAEHGQNYYSSFTSTQDRGTMGYESNSNESYTTDVKTTDGLRVTLGNNEESVWTWMYYGSIFHQSNFKARKSGLSRIDYTGNWWAAPMVPSPNIHEDAIYVAAGNRLKKFTFNPESSAIIATDHYVDFKVMTGNEITGFGYSPLNPNKWYVTVKNGTFLYSIDGGQSFETSSYTGARPLANDQSYNYHKNQHVIKGSKIDVNKVYYAGVGKQFLISEDGGETFTNRSAGLDVYRIRDFDLSPDEKFIFAACAYGGIWVFSVDDNRWYPMNDESVPYVDFTDVEYMIKENSVNFASYGNGILRLKLDVPDHAIAYPENLTGEAIGNFDIKLNWEDKSNNENGFIIERAANGIFSQVGSTSANEISFTDIGIDESGVYCYRVKAYNTSDKSHYSNYVIVELKPAGEVLKKNWELVSVNSEELSGYGAIKAFDDDPSSMWHTQWTVTPMPTHPHTLVIDMNETIELFGFSYLPRQDNQWNGTVQNYEFHISLDNLNWTKASSGSWAKTKSNKEVYFSTPQQARYIKLIALNEVNGAVFASCAEISVMNQLPTELAPNTPQFIQGGRLSDSVIELLWMDMSNDEKGFVVEQLVNGVFTEIYTAPQNTTKYNVVSTDQNRTYEFRLKSFNDLGASKYSEVLTVYGQGVAASLDKNKRQENSVLVYPNPFTNELNVSVKDALQFSQWDVIDLTGKVIKSGIISEQNEIGPIDLHVLNTGRYLFRLKGKDGTIVKPIVKK